MKISVDTKEDSHDDIKKVIRMLQNLVGDSQEIFTNEPTLAQEASPIANIFGDVSLPSDSESAGATQEAQETQAQTAQEAAEEASQSTEDLFAELFSEEELKNMEAESVKEKEENKEEELPKAKSKKHSIEFY